MPPKRNNREIDVFGAPAEGSLPSQSEGSSNPLTDKPQDWYAKSMGHVDENRQTAEPLDIMKIYPDAAQPRRTIPSRVRSSTHVDPRTIGMIFNRWVQLARQESGQSLDLKAMITASVQEDTFSELSHISKDDHPLTYALLDLVNLATSIYHDGLTNPITASRMGREYKIETGERRWLAHHLLHSLTGEFTRISTKIQQFNIWRQATENTARAELNAISKARQFARLLMSLYEQEHEFEDFEQLVAPGTVDQPYYAQVADGNTFRIPRGMGDRFLQALGEKHSNRLTEYRRLLRIEPELWQLADDEGWALQRILTEIRPEKEAIPHISVGYGDSQTPAVPGQTYPNGDFQHSFLDANPPSPSLEGVPGYTPNQADHAAHSSDLDMKQWNARVKLLRAGLTEEEIQSGQWLPMTNDVNDQRVVHVITGEVRGGPQATPSQQHTPPPPPPYQRPPSSPATPPRERTEEEVNSALALRRRAELETAAYALMQQKDITILDYLSPDYQVKVRETLEFVILHSITLWMQATEWPNLVVPTRMLDAFQDVYEMFYRPTEE